MSSELKKQLRAARNEAKSSTARLLGILTGLSGADGSTLKKAAIIPGLHITLEEMGPRLGHTDAAIARVASVAASRMLGIPQTTLAQLIAQTGALSTACNTMADAVESWGTATPVARIDPNTFSAHLSNGSEVSLVAWLAAINGAVDKVLTHANALNPVLHSESYDAFSGQFELAETLIARAAEAKEAALAIRRVAKTAETQILSRKTSADIAASAAEEAATKAEAASDGATVGKTQVDALLASAEGLDTKAGALKSRVEEFQADFDEFDSQLMKRNKDLAEGSEQLDILRDSLETKERELDTIINESKEALGWATAKGLASAFATASKNLDIPLGAAIGLYVFAILFLLASVLMAFMPWPLVAWLGLNVDIPPLSPPPGLEGISALLWIVSSLGTRLAILLPGLLLASLANHAYKTSVRMKEGYLYKKTIAGALPGFRQAARETKSTDEERAMAAAAFAKLLQEPQQELGQASDKEDHASRLSKLLDQIIEKRVDKRVAKAVEAIADED